MKLQWLVVAAFLVTNLRGTPMQDGGDLLDNASSPKNITVKLDRVQSSWYPDSPYYIMETRTSFKGLTLQKSNVMIDIEGPGDFWLVVDNCHKNDTASSPCTTLNTDKLLQKKRANVIPNSKFTSSDGDVNGELGKAAGVWVGSEAPKQKRDFVFGLAETTISNFTFAQAGYLNFGFSNNSGGGFTTNLFVQGLLDNSVINEPLITIVLKRPNSFAAPNPDTITFGGDIKTICGSDTKFLKIRDQGGWELDIASVTLTNTTGSEQELKHSNRTAKFSLTKDYIQFPGCPGHLFNKTYNIGAEVDCSDIVAKKFQLKFKASDGSDFEIDSNSLIRRTPNGKCKYPVVRAGKEDPWILGLPFYQAFCVSHDYGGRRVGITKQ